MQLRFFKLGTVLTYAFNIEQWVKDVESELNGIESKKGRLTLEWGWGLLFALWLFFQEIFHFGILNKQKVCQVENGRIIWKQTVGWSLESIYKEEKVKVVLQMSFS